MGFSGKIEDFELPDLLQAIALTQKSGKLTITRRDGHGVVVLRRGRIIYAASSSVRETFGNILVLKGRISEATLMEALERQRQEGSEKRLGTVLLEMGKVTPEDLEDAMRHQVGLVLAELLGWKSGFAKFEKGDIPERGEIELDATEFLKEGLDTSGALLLAAAQLDEQTKAEAVPPAAASLGTMLADMNATALRGEVTLRLLRQASRVVRRGILFAVRGEEVRAVGRFGFERGSAGKESLRVPLAEPSVLTEVIQRKESYKGPLPATPGNARLLSLLGGPAPEEIVLVPMVLGSAVVTIFYGDNAPEGRPIGLIGGLELAVTEAVLAMEKEAVEERIRNFERLRRRPLEDRVEGDAKAPSGSSSSSER